MARRSLGSRLSYLEAITPAVRSPEPPEYTPEQQAALDELGIEIGLPLPPGTPPRVIRRLAKLLHRCIAIWDFAEIKTAITMAKDDYADR